MPFIDLRDVRQRDMLPGFKARFIHTDNVTISYWDVQAGFSLPEHAHPHEQITNILSGTFKITVDGETKVIEPGEVVVIPAHAKHSGLSMTDCYILDVFYPIREDYR